MAKKEKRPPLRQYLMDGDFFIGAALSATLTKLVLRYADLEQEVVGLKQHIQHIKPKIDNVLSF